ncbi:hypothetical protein SNE40_017063 [Patella caerulea]
MLSKSSPFYENAQCSSTLNINNTFQKKSGVKTRYMKNKKNGTDDDISNSRSPDAHSVLMKMLNEASPIKSLRNITCKDVRCKCFLRQCSPQFSRNIGLEEKNKEQCQDANGPLILKINTDSSSRGQSSEIYVPVSKTITKQRHSTDKEKGTRTTVDKELLNSVTKSVVAKPDKQIQYKDVMHMVELAKRNLEEDVHQEALGNSSAKKYQADVIRPVSKLNEGDVRLLSSGGINPPTAHLKKRTRKTLSLSTWRKRQRDEEEALQKQLSSELNSKIHEDDSKIIKNTRHPIHAMNGQQNALDNHKILHTRFSNEYRHRKLVPMECSQDLRDIQKGKATQLYSCHRTKSPQLVGDNQNVKATGSYSFSTSTPQKQKVTPNSSVTNTPTDPVKISTIPQQISFVKKDMGFPIIFSPQRRTSLESKHAGDIPLRHSSDGYIQNEQPIYASYGTVPAISQNSVKSATPIFVLPYLLVPPSTVSPFSPNPPKPLDLASKNSDLKGPTKRILVHQNSSLNKPVPFVKLEKLEDSEKIQPQKQERKAKKCADERPPFKTNHDLPQSRNSSKRKHKYVSASTEERPALPLRFHFNKTLSMESVKERQKIKFALSLELLKVEPEMSCSKAPVGKPTSCHTNYSGKERISFVPAVQVKKLDTHSCYTLQVVSLIRTKIEHESSLDSSVANLGWTPAAINRTSEGHINMVFVPKICTGLYLIEDLGTTNKTKENGHHDVRLIPFAPSLEIPDNSTALAVGRPEPSWAACVDFLKQIQQSASVHQAIMYVTGGKECSCSSVIKSSARELKDDKPLKKSKYTSIALPKCKCCQCKPRSKRKQGLNFPRSK